MASHPMASAFLYYSPDPTRQQGHFVPHPHSVPHSALQQQQMSVFPVVPTLPSTPMYSRPGSANSQPAVHPKAFSGFPSALTPVASPQPIAHKPTIVLDTDLSEGDGLYYPSTPPLSSSGSSVISSPGSCDMLQTPLNPMFSGLDGVDPKDTRDIPESFPVLEWTGSCASPPMTPGTVFFFFLIVSSCRAGLFSIGVPACQIQAGYFPLALAG